MSFESIKSEHQEAQKPENQVRCNNSRMVQDKKGCKISPSTGYW